MLLNTIGKPSLYIPACKFGFVSLVLCEILTWWIGMIVWGMISVLTGFTKKYDSFVRRV